MIKTITDLWESQKAIWKHENEYWFGVSPLAKWSDVSVANTHLALCADRFWNNGTNQLKELLENGKCKDIDKLIPGSYELVFDPSGIICLYGTFNMDVEERDGTKKTVQKRAPLSYLPYPNELCWFFGDTEYVLRIAAVPNYGLLYRVGDDVYYQKAWIYHVKEDKYDIFLDDFDPYESLTTQNRNYLGHVLRCKPEEVDEAGMKKGMSMLPQYDGRNVLYFKFCYVDEMFNLVRRSSRFANPLMKVSVPINIMKMFTAQRIRDDQQERGEFSNLVLASNKLFALENSRTVLYKSRFNTTFQWNGGEHFFDAFKTSTNKSAGRSRLLLDDANVKDGMLWTDVLNKDTGQVEHRDMYDVLLFDDKWERSHNLSVLSCSDFSMNNAPKRMMMTAKLRAQAIPTRGETDPFTHDTPARIVFGDFEGFNFGDGIVLSRSFARKLCSHYEQKRTIQSYADYVELVEKYAIGDQMDINDLNKLIGSTMCNNYRNIKIDNIDPSYVAINADAPFGVGDKLTNMHGSKGVGCIIMEDEDMPYLKYDLSPKMPAGPFDVIVSGLSVFRRKSLGQIFEAWARAMGVEDVGNIQDAAKSYLENMKEYSEKSVVVFQGKESIKPCGINMMIRLDHNAVGKQSHSYIKSNYAKMLKLGEMEILNLASRGMEGILNEIDIRSVSKHFNSLQQIRTMQKTGKINREPANSLRFFNLLKTIGFDFNLREPTSISHIHPQFAKVQQMLTDDVVDIFDEDYED